MKCMSADGNKVFVNVCGHFDVSDAVSLQGIDGCPYMILTTSNPALIGIQDANIQVYHVIVHMKYLYAALDEHSEIKMKVRQL